MGPLIAVNAIGGTGVPLLAKIAGRSVDAL